MLHHVMLSHVVSCHVTFKDVRGVFAACSIWRFHWEVDFRVSAWVGVVVVSRRGATDARCTERAFRVAGVGNGGNWRRAGHLLCGWRGNRAHRVKLLDFVALCAKSAVCVQVDVLARAKMWQAQGIRGFVLVTGVSHNAMGV